MSDYILVTCDEESSVVNVRGSSGHVQRMFRALSSSLIKEGFSSVELLALVMAAGVPECELED